MAEEPTVNEAVEFTNKKTLAEAASFAMGMAFQDSIDHRRRLNVLAESYLASALKNANEIDPSEAVSTLKELSGNDLGQQIVQLLAALGANQQGSKVAQTTPPVTP